MKWLGSIDGGIVTGGCRSLSSPEFSSNSASGWTTSLATPYIEYIGKDNLYTSRGFPLDDGVCVNAPPPENNWAAWSRRLMVHLPSGETHELRATDEEPVLYDRSSTCPPAYGYTCDPNSYWLQANWDRTFYAVDGSNIKYVEDSGTNTYRLQMPDGSFYDFETSETSIYEATARRAVKFTDRNGNYTSYNTQTGVWTDTLGRTLAAPIGLTAPSQPTPAGCPVTYSLPGMTGSYKFHWKYLKGTSAAESGLTDYNQDLKYTGDKIAMGNNGNWTYHPSGTFLFGSTFDSYVKSSGDVFNPIVLTEIDLPTGQSYKFSYNVYGLIEKITYPTGASEDFVYSAVAPLTPGGNDNVTDQTNFGVTDRKVYETAGQGTPYEWTYTAGGSPYSVTVTNPDGTRTERFLHPGNGPCPACEEGTFGFDDGLAGMPYEERAYDSANHLLSKKLTTWTTTSFNLSNGAGTMDWHPRITQEESQIYDTLGNGISATTTHEFRGDLNQITTPVLQNKVSQYAFVTVGSPLPASPVRSTETTYLIDDPNYSAVAGNYTAQNMIGLPTVISVKDSAGNIVSQHQTVYDESGYSPGYRGDPTTAKVWDSTKGVVTNSAAFISTHAKFDAYGNQYQATDALGNTATTTFDATYQAFPVTVTSAVPDPTGVNGSSTAFITSATYDFTTGLPLTTTDANGQTTTMEYNDPLLRPTKVTAPNGQQTITEYGAGTDASTRYVKVSTQIDASNWKVAYSWYDGLGRAYRSQQVNSNGDIFADKQFDGQGRVSRVSNPYRTGETLQWTTNIYDEASRVKEVDLPDGATVKTDYGVSTSAIVGVTKQITDQAGKKRKGISDALGNMVRVIEDPDGQNLSTDYTFDVLGNLRKTVQGEQSRYFMHDSLGHLLYAKQVEQDANAAFVATDPVTGNSQWSVKYVYDDNGNITSTTDARNVSVTATYDHFNRITLRDFSDATPDVGFYYDGTGLGGVPAYSKGKTTRVSSSVSDTRYTSFDNMGRLLTHQQITGGTTYNTSYTYNLSGALIEETYPSGRKVRNTLDTNGDLSLVETQPSGGAYQTRANNFTRNSAGAITKMQLGNGRWETAAYNNRQQVTQIGLGTTSTSQDLLKLDYDYGTPTQNNGSMRGQTITVPTVGANPGFTATQSYAYDDLNRLQSATETIGGSQTWKQTFTYDRYGNRRFDAANTTTLGSCTQAQCNPTVATSNNRFSTGQGYSYDANGSVTQNAEGMRFTYDAENHQNQFFAVGNASGTPDATYSYDGDGQRVSKVSATENTIFVYDASGVLIEEYSGGVVQTSYVYAGGKLLTTETATGTSYLTADHLGSPRAITDATGAVIDRKDYAAFGDEIYTAQRTTGLGYANQTKPRQGYTGYEKDTESSLDYAQARYYSSMHGRFTSIDPLTASATIRNPQTFNRYSYALNSPYKFTDPLGLIWQGAGTCNGMCAGGYVGPHGGGAFDSAMWGGFGGENELVTVDLNIVYDSAQFSRDAAANAVADTVQDLQNAFSAINVTFNVTYTPGSAEVAPKDNPECANCAYNITKGGINGAINVFLHDNPTAQGPISQFIPKNSQIFLENVPGKSFGQKLATEVGHLFRFFVNGNPMTGRKTAADNNAGNIVDEADKTETPIVHNANDVMRRGGLVYGRDYVDDYRNVKEADVGAQIIPSSIYSRAKAGSLPAIRPRVPTVFDIYRLGARRVAEQRR